VERAAGRSNAFSELVNRYERKIYRMARNITQNNEDAEDILQDSFLKAFTHLDTFQASRNSTLGWSELRSMRLNAPQKAQK